MEFKIACCMLALDRQAITIETTLHNIDRAGMPIDLFVWDNGSEPQQKEGIYKSLFNTQRLIYYGTEDKNIGVGKAFNKLIKKAQESGYNMVVLLGNDIKNGTHWLKKIHQYAVEIPNSGLIALHWGCGANPIIADIINGLPVNKTVGVFGVMALTPHVLENVGYMCEDYHPYGLEDSDLNIRVNGLGLQSYYIPNVSSVHIANDVGQNTPYRKMKNDSLSNNLKTFEGNVAKYHLYNHYYIGYGNCYTPPTPHRTVMAEPINKQTDK